VTSGHTGASACVPEAGTAQVRRVRRVADVAAHDVAPERVSVFPVLLVFH
jgi:hypothetical protein